MASLLRNLLDDGLCNLMNIYVVLASWVNPLLRTYGIASKTWCADGTSFLVLVYSTCLGVMVYKHRNSAAAAGLPKQFDVEGATTPRHAELPIMQLPSSHHSFASFAASRHISGIVSQPPWLAAPPSHQAVPDVSVVDDEDSDAASKKRKSSRSSARLSKPLPSKYF
jgi:hypothetical protein